ncbi:hypothetical protein [Mycolicibacterium pallens]|uniref:Uncharacterized protein n=1 Tax=Mycolicibacterium pallens TaxID=370524 RepID=A0ABX8VM23_9MYCO|nr:hypothetical protein [Mycolicibacterium pallens]QYL16611.1 hypothetical protein K0O64_27095 [Mycolicibacterium pallens]
MGELVAAAVVTVDAACTRAEWPVVDGVVAAAAVVVAVVVAVAVASVSTAAAATAVLLAAADDALRELTLPPDEVAELVRAECATAFLVVVDSVPFDDVEPLSELLAEVLAAPDPAPVSA